MKSSSIQLKIYISKAVLPIISFWHPIIVGCIIRRISIKERITNTLRRTSNRQAICCHFILASRSPRREQLLKELGLKFDIVIKDYKEDYPVNLSVSEIAEYLAHEKAIRFQGGISDNDIVITADTIVWCSDKVLDKPSDNKEAIDILRIISGKTHDVITGVTFF